ncbi:MAG TPA: TlyA family RNA methyltransferase [Clostridia bacterium]|nr:TlyA family RNA methyltransferase [Clostridia bacterium]
MPKVSKERLDVILVKKGLIGTREKAKRVILAGTVYVSGERIDKVGTMVNPKEDIVVKGDPIPFVSRGGLKLKEALEVFNIPVRDRIYIDVGASTGGFTDCLLQNGAKKVYAVDVGYGQLAWSLRQDNRVVVMERTNIRNVSETDFEDDLQGAVIDVAFISLKIVLPVVKNILVPGSHIITLIKPQFEAGREKVGKNGVVLSPKTHIEVLRNILLKCSQLNLTLKGLTFSPVKGPKGNIEFLAHLYSDKKGGLCYNKDRVDVELVHEVVKAAHLELIV